MKKLIITSLFLSFFFPVFGQENRTLNHELLGTLILDSKDILSYKIIFDVEKNGNLNGYSYTDIAGEYETKSYIKGNYNKKDKTINFYEEDILYTKAKFSPSDFCFVNFKGRFKIRNNKKILNGNFVGIYDDKDTCAKGRVRLIDINYAEKKIKKLYKKVKKIKRVDSTTKEKLKPKIYLKKFSETRIKSEEEVSVFIYTSKMKLEIWDYGKEDGDIVNIFLNDKLILENYSVTKERKRLVLNLTDKKNRLKITTISAGKLKTNTAKIKIYDFMRQYEIVSDLQVGKSAYVNIIKLQPKKKIKTR